jgi:hypothetical protein
MNIQRHAKRVCQCLLGLAFCSGSAWANSPVVNLEVFPGDVHLQTSRDRQSFVVMATRADGVTEDVTAAAKVGLSNPAPARLEGHTLAPAADGSTSLDVEYQGRRVAVPVVVKDAQVERPISFKLDVMPVFMRAGCNTGNCHGAARGKDGFMLSLFGYDPDGDHYRLTHEIGFRRVNLAMPRESLVLQKCDGSVPHTGGKRFAPDSEQYNAILRWLEAGVPKDGPDVAQVVSVELYPPKVVLESGASQQFTARAKYSDGTDRDVTSSALFLSNNDNSAPISADGLVTAGARGEAFVMVRFSTFTVGSQVLVLPKGLQYTAPNAPPANYIDELVDAKLRNIRILPSGQCSDEVFLRRVTIDIVGMLPTTAEYQAFLADQDPAKRSKWIDQLLERKEFSEIWAMKWADLLLIRTNNNTVSEKAVHLYSDWLTNQISNDVPLNQMVKEMLGATGGNFKNPASNFYQVERDTLKMAENVAQVFLGIRVQCSQCHNHPFDRWTMNDYYSFAAFFSQVGRKAGEDYRETIVFNAGGGEMRNPVTKQQMAPRFLGGPLADVAGKDRRAVLADWLASADNPYFATSVANRVWAHFFGVGIVEPVDDIRVSNPPSNPDLFNALGAKFASYNYNFKQLVRDICNSHAYQRTSEVNESNQNDEKNFAHALIRRIPAESLLDCISQVTQTSEKFRGLPLGARAVQIADGRSGNFFLKTFGRSDRETVCACEATTEPTLSQALHLLNGETLERKIRSGVTFKQLLDGKKTPAENIETLYLTCLSRKPTPEESQRLEAILADEPARADGLHDLFWALLNSREFLFNH